MRTLVVFDTLVTTDMCTSTPKSAQDALKLVALNPD